MTSVCVNRANEVTALRFAAERLFSRKQLISFLTNILVQSSYPLDCSLKTKSMPRLCSWQDSDTTFFTTHANLVGATSVLPLWGSNPFFQYLHNTFKISLFRETGGCQFLGKYSRAEKGSYDPNDLKPYNCMLKIVFHSLFKRLS